LGDVPHIDFIDPAEMIIVFKKPDGAPAGGVFLDIPGTFLVEAKKSIEGLDVRQGNIRWELDMQGTRDFSFKTFIRCACAGGEETVAVIRWDATIFAQAGSSQAESFGSASGACQLVAPVPAGDLEQLQEARNKAKRFAQKLIQKTIYAEQF